MADWLEITNTFINLETMQRVGDLSRNQEQVANQAMAIEARKQRDNALLSQLVDVVVKVRQFLQDQQSLDALLSAGVGVIAFSQLYPQLVDADTKLKASDIQVKLVESMRSAILDDSIKRTLQTSLAQYFSTINGLLQQTLLGLKQSQHKLIWLNPDNDWQIDVAEELTPTQDVIDLSSKVVIFRKGKLYRVIDVNTSAAKGFYLINEFGQKWYLFFGKRGGANLFAFLDPPIPSLENEIASWELCNKVFSDEFLLTNLKSLRLEMLGIYSHALEQANISKVGLAEAVAQYKHFRQESLNQALQATQIQVARQIQVVTKPKEYVIISIVVISLLIILTLLRQC